MRGLWRARREAVKARRQFDILRLRLLMEDNAARLAELNTLRECPLCVAMEDPATSPCGGPS